MVVDSKEKVACFDDILDKRWRSCGNEKVECEGAVGQGGKGREYGFRIWVEWEELAWNKGCDGEKRRVVDGVIQDAANAAEL